MIKFVILTPPPQHPLKMGIFTIVFLFLARVYMVWKCPSQSMLGWILELKSLPHNTPNEIPGPNVSKQGQPNYIESTIKGGDCISIDIND